MSKIDDGGPAFPLQARRGVMLDDGTIGPNPFDLQGMSLRDWFAGQALMGFMACPDGPSDRSVTARFCFEYADAMLKARKTEAA